MLFASSRLTELRLGHLLGVSNEAFKKFLEIAVGALQVIHVENINFHGASADEDYALDTAMPLMTRLKELEVGTLLASIASLSGRRSNPRLSRTATISFILDKEKGIGEELLEAIEITGWNIITIQTPNVSVIQASVAIERLAIDKSRGIFFRIDNPSFLPM
jgi:hypothetical protein